MLEMPRYQPKMGATKKVELTVVMFSMGKLYIEVMECPTKEICYRTVNYCITECNRTFIRRLSSHTVGVSDIFKSDCTMSDG